MVVTGATGYIASWIVKELLAQGFRVRATVRDPSNTKRLKVCGTLPAWGALLSHKQVNPTIT